MRVPVSTFALALALAGCSGKPAPGTTAPPPSGSTPAPASPSGTYFTVPAQQLPHLQVVPVTTATWTTILHTTGTVDWDNEHTTQAITQVSGPITRILVDTGTRVKKGDVLLYVSSPEITSAISTYRKAKNRLDLAQRTLDRNKDLLD